VNLLQRIRRFLESRSDDDHPLTEQEREEARPVTTFEERARVEQEFVGDDFDPDEPSVGARD
jgi:hypothetical protein